MTNKKEGLSVLQRIDWRWDLLGVSIVYLVEGILDMATLAVAYYCKDTLGLGPSSAGLFQTAGQIPWELTPLLGLITDLCPLMGYRRKAYLLLVGLTGSACWWLLAWDPAGAGAHPDSESGSVAAPMALAALLLVVANACTAWTQVIADAVLVGMSQGHEQDVASFYQALSWITYTSGAVLSAYSTGVLLDSYGPRPVFVLAAGGLLLDAACAALITEVPVGKEAAVVPMPPAVVAPLAALASPASAVGQRPEQLDRAYHDGLQRTLWRGSDGGKRAAGYGVEGEEGALREPLLAGGDGEGEGEGRVGEREHGSPSFRNGSVFAAQSTDPAANGSNEGAGAGHEEQHVGEARLAARVLSPRGSGFISLHRPPSVAGSRRTLGTPPGSPGPASRAPQTAAGLIRTVATTLSSPTILAPAVFIFCWQACPSPSAAMFYFQTTTLHFSAQFQEMVYLAGSFAGVGGVLLYQWLLVHRPLRVMLLWCALLGSAFSATQLLLVSRLNVRLGISDKLFVLGDYAMLSAIAEVMMTPMLALSARVCPPGVEATLYACLYSMLNLSGALSGALGALLTRACGVTGEDADDGSGGAASEEGGRLLLLVALCNAAMLLPLPLLYFVPEMEVPKEGAEEVEGSRGGVQEQLVWSAEDVEAQQQGLVVRWGSSMVVPGDEELGGLEGVRVGVETEGEGGKHVGLVVGQEEQDGVARARSGAMRRLWCQEGMPMVDGHVPFHPPDPGFAPIPEGVPVVLDPQEQQRIMEREGQAAADAAAAMGGGQQLLMGAADVSGVSPFAAPMDGDWTPTPGRASAGGAPLSPGLHTRLSSSQLPPRPPSQPPSLPSLRPRLRMARAASAAGPALSSPSSPSHAPRASLRQMWQAQQQQATRRGLQSRHSTTAAGSFRPGGGSAPRGLTRAASAAWAEAPAAGSPFYTPAATTPQPVSPVGSFSVSRRSTAVGLVPYPSPYSPSAPALQGAGRHTAVVRLVGRPVVHTPLAGMGGLVGAQVGVSPLVRLARTRSLMQLLGSLGWGEGGQWGGEASAEAEADAAGEEVGYEEWDGEPVDEAEAGQGQGEEAEGSSRVRGCA